MRTKSTPAPAPADTLASDLSGISTATLCAVAWRIRTAIKLVNVDDIEARRIANTMPSGPRGIYMQLREEFLTMRPEFTRGDAALDALDYARTLLNPPHN